MKRTFHLTRGPEDAPNEVRREIELHLELRTREFEAQGMGPEEARRAAIVAFGDRDRIEAEVSSLRGGTLQARLRRDRVGELAQDLRIALRGLRRGPGFTLLAVLTLALSIGANSAIFSVVRSVLLRPLPYPDSRQLVQLWTDHRSKGRVPPEWLTPPEFLDWQTGNRTFASMAAYQRWSPDLTRVGEPESLSGLAVSWNFLDLLGVPVAQGRGFRASDDDAGSEAVVLLSDGLWRRRFGSDPSMLGKAIQLNAEPWTVIGVLPASFRPPIPADVWRPTRRPANSQCGRGCIVVRAIGRMKPGVTLPQAQSDLAAIQERAGREFPEGEAGVGAWPILLHEQITGPAKPALLALSGAVFFVLLIGCVNLANLLLLRGAARAREISVRAALGAGRGRLLRQLLTESLVLAAVGGFAGLALGWYGSRLLSALVPAAVRGIQTIRLDWTAVAFTAGLTLLAGLLFGLVPALHAARPDLMSSLRTSGRESGHRGHLLRDGLVVAELALAVVLLVGAGLLGRSFVELQRVDLGFRTDSVTLASVLFPRARYPTPERALVALEDVLFRTRSNSAVRGIEGSDQPPLLGGGDQDVDVTPVGEALPGGKPFDIWYRAVTPGFTQLMGMRLVAGRGFTPEDRAGAVPVGIVNEEAGRRMWGGKSPLGRELRSGNQRLTIVGVVATAKPDGPNQPVKMELFFSILQSPTRAVTFVIDPKRDVPSAVAALRSSLNAVDPEVAVSGVITMAEQAGEAVALPRLYALLVGIFATAALALAILGVYGVMAYAVAQRQREIGVRLALGAAPGAIRRLVLGQGTRLAAIGVGLGLLGATLFGSVLKALLFGVRALDLPTFLGVALLLAGMSLLACLLPAQRAMRVDPLVAIREE